MAYHYVCTSCSRAYTYDVGFCRTCTHPVKAMPSSGKAGWKTTRRERAS